MKVKKIIFVMLCSLFLMNTSYSQNNKDSLIKIVNGNKKDTNMVKALVYLGRLEMQGDVEKAKEYFNKAIEIGKAKKFYRSGGSAITYMGILNFSLGNMDKASEYFTDAYKFYLEGGLNHNAAKAVNNLGFMYYNKGDMPKALDCYQKALNAFENSDDNNAISTCISNITAIYFSFENFDKMIEYYKIGLKIFEKRKDTLNIGIMYCNMVVPYTEKKIMDTVLIYLNNAEKQYKLKNDESHLAFLYNCFGMYYTETNDLKKAEESIVRSIEMATKTSNFKQLSFNYDVYGDLMLKKRSFKEAITMYKKSLDIQTQLKLHSYMVKKYYKLGQVSDSLRDYKNSIIYYTQCLEIAKASGLKETVKSAYRGLFNAYRSMGDYKRSLEYYMYYSEEKDSILNSESVKSMNELSTKYETEKKQLQIENLNKEKAIQESELETSRIQKIALSSGIILMLALVIIAVRAYKQKQKANVLLEEQKGVITQQKHIVEEKQKEIIDSINYAKRIQSTLLAHTDFLNDNIENNFVLFKPKDIVSGDFYWATKHGNLFYLAVCDSTGHGVPGAFMSLLNIGFLSEAINEKDIREPHKVFNYVRQRLIDGISKEGQKDGFDGILICIDQKTKKITYTAANNAPIIIRNGEITELEKDRMPVGKGERTDSFTTHQIELEKNDSLYLYTDGYADQFGGPKGKKFLYKRLNELLRSLNPDDLHKRGDKLNVKFEEWKGNLEQVDDVLVIGIKI